MKLPETVMRLMVEAEQKALATMGDDGPNVVPISMVDYEADIVIYDCFMGRSVRNLEPDNRASVAFWKGFSGVQVKGHITYERSGERFDRAAARLKEMHPDRVLKGILILNPEAAYDLSPANAGTKLA